jgi:hypothetical protein
MKSTSPFKIFVQAVNHMLEEEISQNVDRMDTSTLRAETEEISETLVFNSALTPLIA